jgi:hypothetical protein
MLLLGSDDTITVSASPPNWSVTSTSAVPAARRMTPGFSDFLKSFATTSIRYVPGRRFGAS